MSELIFFNNDMSIYEYDYLYESFIQSKIDAEDRLAYAMKESMILNESDYSNIKYLQEAKTLDKIKSKWHRFVEFIKKIIDKFMVSMDNILLNNKKYLEKYKDVILKNKPKSEIKYSYLGNYEIGMDRILNSPVPIFDYNKYKNEFDAEGNGELIKAFMSDKQAFTYNDKENPATLCKKYFLAHDKGEKKGSFSDLDFTRMYNFCYDFNKYKTMISKDRAKLNNKPVMVDSDFNNIINNNSADKKNESFINNNILSIYKEDNSNNENTNSANNDNNGNTNSANNNSNNENTNSANNDNNSNNNDNGKLTITTNDENNANKNMEYNNALANAMSKYTTVASAIITAKYTACQIICKDYMSFIKAHVHSYGADAKQSNNNKTENKK